MIIGSKTLHYLGWDRVVGRLADHAATAAGRLLTESLTFLKDSGEIERELRRIEELKELIGSGYAPDFGGITELEEILLRSQREGVLDATELLQVGDCTQALSRLYAFVVTHRRKLESSLFLNVRMHDHRVLAGRISSSIERDGTIRDEASAMLADLRRQASSAHQAIRSRLDDFLKSRQAEEILQERYFTLREDRYVIPVRAERKSTLDGIIHGVSQSGATVFLEPRFLISLNNRLKLVQEEVRREELAVLRELSEMVAQSAPPIRESLEMAALFDLLAARARLALEMKADAPAVGDNAELRLCAVRSPLLLIRGEDKVVPNDIRVGGEYSFLVLSGPNAGGKSVCLKSCGLALLMVHAGLQIPAGRDSYVPCLEGLHALPGDLEDVDMQLSTFSGHLEELNRTLAQVGPGHLVLIDEITVGTEPDQGSALGASFLLELADTGATGMVATHYERLKALAMADGRFENGSMGMEWEAMAPTYRLQVGTPGSSRTLEIAHRFSVPDKVIRRAREILQGKGGGMLEDAIRSLGEQKEQVVALRLKLDEEQREAEQLKRRRGIALEQLSRNAQRVIHRKVSQGVEDVSEALDLVSGMVAQLQRAQPDHDTLASRRRTLKDVQKRLKERKQELETGEAVRELGLPSGAEFVVGGEVLVKKFKKKATVLALSHAEGWASLKMGPMRLRLPFDEMVALGATAQAPAARARIFTQVPDLTERRVDIRGQMAAEGLAQLEKALDQGMFATGAQLLVVHGHGTGRLRTAVRSFLKETSYPVKFRPGKREEGGDGVTVVEFV